ncbi:hypothetical protein U1Q18_002109, partial [Sarracenia purpurea var. burkii]
KVALERTPGERFHGCGVVFQAAEPSVVVAGAAINETLHKKTRLSFLPLASWWPAANYFRPQTSWQCPLKIPTARDLILTSLLMIRLSSPSVIKMWLLQSSDSTRELCPSLNVLLASPSLLVATTTTKNGTRS